jgi:hypothetical protein
VWSGNEAAFIDTNDASTYKHSCAALMPLSRITVLSFCSYCLGRSEAGESRRPFPVLLHGSA